MAYQSWSVVFGEIPSAAKWNILGTNDAHFYSFLGDNLAWQSWVPTLTNLSGGTLNYAKYSQVGKTVAYRFRYTLGGAGVAGSVSISLPVNQAADYSTAGTDEIGNGLALDSGTNQYPLKAYVFTSNTILLRPVNAAGTYAHTGTDTSSTVPFTWAVNDVIYVSGSYEAA